MVDDCSLELGKGGMTTDYKEMEAMEYEASRSPKHIVSPLPSTPLPPVQSPQDQECEMATVLRIAMEAVLSSSSSITPQESTSILLVLDKPSQNLKTPDKDSLQPR